MREERREEKRCHYMRGEARRPHVHTRSMVLALSKSSPSGGEQVDKICKRFKPVLSRYVTDFNELAHRGLALKRYQYVNPAPRKPDKQHYRDVKKQNEWLRENMFDALGNYLYCSPCICNAFGISTHGECSNASASNWLRKWPYVPTNWITVIHAPH